MLWRVQVFLLCLSTASASEAFPPMSPAQNFTDEFASEALPPQLGLPAQNFSNGLMELPLLMATSLPAWNEIIGCCVKGLAVDGGFVYGIGTADSDVWKAPSSGGSWTKIASCCMTDIAVDGGYVFGAGQDRNLWRVPTSGGEWTHIAGSSVFAIAVQGGYVYGVVSGQVSRVPVAGGSWTSLGVHIFVTHNIAVDGGYVYGINYHDHSVLKMPVAGGSWTKIVDCCVSAITAHAGYVYGIGNDHALWRVPSGGGSWTNIAGPWVSDIAVEGGHVYGVGNRHNVLKVTGNADLGSQAFVQLDAESSFATIVPVALMAAVAGLAFAFSIACARTRMPRSEPLLSA